MSRRGDGSDEEWIADPVGDRPRRVRLTSRGAHAGALRARRPRPGRRRQRRHRRSPRWPGGERRHGRMRVAARPALAQTTSGYIGTASDPWNDLSADDLDHALRRDRAWQRRAGGASPAHRPWQQPAYDPRDRLRPDQRPPVPGDRLARQGLRPARRRYATGWFGYLSLSATPELLAQRGAAERVQPVAIGSRRLGGQAQPRRGVASPTMPWVWGTLTLENTESSGPYHLVWPRDLYHVATAQQVAATRRLPAAARLPVAGSEARRLVLAEHRGRRPEHWTTEQLDEVSLPIVLAWHSAEPRRPTGPTCARPPTTCDNGPQPDQERWENQTAGRRTRSRPRSRG